MPNHSFYLLCNDSSGSESEHETLEAALNAVDQTVGERDHWAIHEFLRGSVARWVTDGYGRTASLACGCVNSR